MVADDGEELMLKELLRLPMYLQLANKNDEGWVDSFEFASWLFDDTQSDIFRDFEYLLERGVEAKFAIKTLKADSDGMWEPRISELRSAGVLTQ